MKIPAYYIGLMSGTSVDGIDAVMVDFSSSKPRLMAAQTYAWDAALHQRIINVLNNPEQTTLYTLGALDAQLGEAFAHAALQLISDADVNTGEITAIGSHGQTLLHAPDAATPFSTQAGDPNRIAELTGINTVADFRRRDIAAGGQGAPLVPAFHQALFQKKGCARAILNIGGIANLTLLPADPEQPVTGFDTGPGNTLMDAWIKSAIGETFDKNGDWARSGQCQPKLLQDLLNHPYFKQSPPKSTGRELFNMSRLQQQAHTRLETLPPEHIQATLAELTVQSISASLPSVSELYVCGGGAHNGYLMERLCCQLESTRVATTEALGLAPDWVEATAFAWLAKQTLERRSGNLHTATGARHAVVLGGVYPGRG